MKNMELPSDRMLQQYNHGGEANTRELPVNMYLDTIMAQFNS